MATTNNGWAKDPLVVRIYIGTDRDGAEVAVGDVAVVLEEFLTRFSTEVEAVYSVNGYRSAAFNATLAGSVASSNHVSGTAVDVNGDRHPNEAAHGGRLLTSGFTPAQLAKLAGLLRDFPVIVWGGNASAKFPLHARDYMHFEIHGTPAQVTAFANTLRTPPPVVVVDHPIVVAQEVPLMRLIRIREDGRIILVGPTLFEKVPDMPHADALALIYGRWVDVSTAEGQRINDQVNHNIEVTAANLRGQWRATGGL